MQTEYPLARSPARRFGVLMPLALALVAALPSSALAQSSEGSTSGKRASDSERSSGSDRSSGGSDSSERSSDSTRADVDSDLDVSPHVRRGVAVSLNGRLAGGESGQTALVEVSSRRGWQTVARATTRAGGRFTATWRPPAPGRFRVRVRPLGEALAAGRGLVASEEVNVYRPGIASWYGPGLYGNRTACGQTIRPGTIGVAHKRLPCGTKVTFRYGSRSVTVPVIDRGPFVAGREWDLTAATKRALRFPSTGTVWSTR